MKYLCIVNPFAGKGQTKKIWPDIKRNLDKLDNNIDYFFTEYRGHAQEIAKEINSNKYLKIIAVGGDGTINEIINGMDFNIPIGLIPTGTGNDLCKTLNIPLDPLEAIITLAQDKIENVNLALADNRYFVNVASVGFDAGVVSWVNNTKIFKKKLAYYLAILAKLILNANYNLTIELDEKKIIKNCTLVAIANGKYYGSGKKIAPRADITDNLFDVVIVNAVSRIEIMKSLPGIQEGKHISNPNISIYKAQNVRISFAGHLPVQLDGEIIKPLPKEFKIADKNLKVFVP